MRQVTDRGKPLVDDPKRLDGVSAVGVDETAFLRACSTHPTLYATGIADLTPGRPARLLDVVEGRSGTVLAGWLAARDEHFRAQIVTASLDPFRGYATALAAQLPKAVRVLDAFHVVKLALTCVDEVRRRTQQDTLGHRGHAQDPLFRTRRLLRRRADRLTTKQRARAPRGAAGRRPERRGDRRLGRRPGPDGRLRQPRPGRRKAAAEKLITTARTCPVPEITRLGRTLTAWRTEFLARFDHPGVSNGPDRMPEPESQEHQTRRPRLPVIRQLQAATTSQPRTHQR